MTERSNGRQSDQASGSRRQGSTADPTTRHTHVSEYRVPKMDCPSEEGMIRMALEGIEPRVLLEFDTQSRRVRVLHGGKTTVITERLRSLGLGATLEKTTCVTKEDVTRAREAEESTTRPEASILKWLLAINGVMFGVEFTAGWLADSTGLIADSLDMFADAAVYGVSLYAVGRSAKTKLHAAHFSGWMQLLLAFGVLAEVGRRFVFGSDPVTALMMGFGLVALAANISCLMLISRNRHGGAHMKASWIFSANDVIANSGVILAGLLVAWTGSRYPDLIIGLIIGLVVLNGARRILQLRH